MELDSIICRAQAILDDLAAGKAHALDATIEARQLLGQHVGKDSEFYAALSDTRGRGDADVRAALTSFIRYAEAGLLTGVSLKRQAQADVLSDLFDQAGVILDGKSFHPAAAVVLIGGVLEDFLRGWVADQALELPGTRRSIDAYAGALKAAGLIDKNDKKEIDVWAGRRNDAAHGMWKQIDKARASMMLEGVRLCMRRHGAKV